MQDLEEETLNKSFASNYFILPETFVLSACVRMRVCLNGQSSEGGHSMIKYVSDLIARLSFFVICLKRAEETS